MKTLLRVFLAIFMMVLGTTTYADSTKEFVKDLNKKSLEESMELVKLLFPTNEDQRQIEKQFKEFKEVSKKWIWRYELDGNKVAFRLNGRVQYRLSDIADNGMSFKLNGTPFSFKSGQSYLSASMQLLELLKKKSAFHKFSLISEAYADGGLFAFAVGTVFVAAADAAEKGLPADLRCVRKAAFNPYSQYRPMAEQKTGRRYYKHGNVCPWVEKHNFSQRHRAVVQNFKPNGKFQTMKVPTKCAGYQGAELLICNCKQVKMNSNCGVGWNMTEPMADATCRMAMETYLSCSNGIGYQSRPTYPSNPEPQTPSTGKCKYGCEAQTPATGNQKYDYPAQQQQQQHYPNQGGGARD